MGLVSGERIERKICIWGSFLEKYRNGLYYLLFFFYRSQNLILFLTATILATINSLLIFNILIYFLVSDC
jgi:hypothetical protein